MGTTLPKSRTRRQLLLDRVQQKSNDILKELASGQQGNLEKLLNFCSTRLTKWSSHNLFCLFVQRPEIQCPISISEVKKLGHEIKKGVSYASILVPIVKEVLGAQLKNDNFSEDLTDSEGSQKQERVLPKNQEIIGWKAIPCVVDLGRDTIGANLGLKRLAQNQQPTDEVLKTCLEASRRYAQKIGLKLPEVSEVSSEKFGNSLCDIIKKNFVQQGGVTGEKNAELQLDAATYIAAKSFGISSHYACSHPESWGSKPSDLLENLRVATNFARQAVLEIGKELEEMIVEKQQQSPDSFIRSHQMEWENAEGITPERKKNSVISERDESEEELESFQVESAKI